MSVCERFDSGAIGAPWTLTQRYLHGDVQVGVEHGGSYVGGHAMRIRVAGLPDNFAVSNFYHRPIGLPPGHLDTGEIWTKFWMKRESFDPRHPTNLSRLLGTEQTVLQLMDAEGNNAVQLEVIGDGKIGVRWRAGPLINYHSWVGAVESGDCWQCIEMRLRNGEMPAIFVNGGPEHLALGDPLWTPSVAEVGFGAVEISGGDASTLLDGLVVSRTRTGCR